MCMFTTKGCWIGGASDALYAEMVATGLCVHWRPGEVGKLSLQHHSYGSALAAVRTVLRDMLSQYQQQQSQQQQQQRGFLSQQRQKQQLQLHHAEVHSAAQDLYVITRQYAASRSTSSDTAAAAAASSSSTDAIRAADTVASESSALPLCSADPRPAILALLQQRGLQYQQHPTDTRLLRVPAAELLAYCTASSALLYRM
jgi:hypothetical protein